MNATTLSTCAVCSTLRFYKKYNDGDAIAVPRDVTLKTLGLMVHPVYIQNATTMVDRFILKGYKKLILYYIHKCLNFTSFKTSKAA